MVRKTFRLLAQNLRLFLPLFLVGAASGALIINASKDTVAVVSVITALLTWLTALFFVRYIVAGKKVAFHDGVYNAATPLISSLLVLITMMLQCVPVMILVIMTASAVETKLFDSFFYGSIFVLFGIAMVTISLCLVPSTLMALVAVSVPGTRPIEALGLGHDLVQGQRMKMVLKIIKLILTVALVAVPLVMLAELVTVSSSILSGIVLYMVMIFAVIFAAVYCYLCYRELLGYEGGKSDKK